MLVMHAGGLSEVARLPAGIRPLAPDFLCKKYAIAENKEQRTKN